MTFWIDRSEQLKYFNGLVSISSFILSLHIRYADIALEAKYHFCKFYGRFMKFNELRIGEALFKHIDVFLRKCCQKEFQWKKVGNKSISSDSADLLRILNQLG